MHGIALCGALWTKKDFYIGSAQRARLWNPQPPRRFLPPPPPLDLGAVGGRPSPEQHCLCPEHACRAGLPGCP